MAALAAGLPGIDTSESRRKHTCPVRDGPADAAARRILQPKYRHSCLIYPESEPPYHELRQEHPTNLMEETMESLLTAIVIWLSSSFDLRADFAHPTIILEAPGSIGQVRANTALEYSGMPAAVRPVTHEQASEIVAFYDDRTRTLHLPAGWTGTTPEELSILVHEMVHHLQNIDGLTYGCAAEREKLAFGAQERWLQMSGSSLWEAFGIDPMTLLIRTNCGF